MAGQPLVSLNKTFLNRGFVRGGGRLTSHASKLPLSMGAKVSNTSKPGG